MADKPKIPSPALTDPSYDPETDTKKSLEGIDFTEPNLADISKEAQATLADYLYDYVTKGRPAADGKGDGNNNDYHPPKSNRVVESYKRGHGLQPPDTKGTGVKQFTQQDEQHLKSTGLGVSKGEKTGKQGTFFEAAQINKLLDKTGGATGPLSTEWGHPAAAAALINQGHPLSGHDLLRWTADNPDVIQRPGTKTEYPAPDGRHPLLKAVVEQLVKANKYHPTNTSPFVNDPGEINEELATKGLFTAQNKMGEFDSNAPRVLVSDMSRMALSLLARSAGDTTSAELICSNDDLGGSLMMAIANPFEQLGITGVSINSLRLTGFEHIPRVALAIRADAANSTARDPKEIESLKVFLEQKSNSKDFLINTVTNTSIAGRGAPPDGDSQPPLQASPLNNVSYGQLNTFLEPFGGMVGSLGMLTIALEGILTLLAISMIIDIVNTGTGKVNRGSPKAPWNYAYGVHGQTSGTGLLDTVLHDLLRITNTDYDFGDCVPQGIALLLGFSPEGGTANILLQIANPATLVNFALNLVLSPAYYANLFRQIMRSVNEVMAAFSAFKSATTSGFTSIMAAIEKLISSKAYQFLMIAAGVGDVALKSTTGLLDVGIESTLLDKSSAMSLSRFGLVQYGVDATTKKLNVKGASIGAFRKHISRWGDGRNPLSLTTFLASQVSQGGLNTKATGDQDSFRSLKPGRDTVEDIERALEAEYVPFYFHDLRTHEVISLPAFIDTFDESFNVNYNSVTGYGRQDPVRLYQSTERTMTFGFKLVAFGEKDFNEMWFMVNKLVSMCYPQYSQGRGRSFKDGKDTYKFIQPFSQVPAASPVIRLRLGDVLKSNYSLPGLNRLFGGVSVAKNKKAVDAAKEKLKKAKAAFVRAQKTQFEKTVQAIKTSGITAKGQAGVLKRFGAIRHEGDSFKLVKSAIPPALAGVLKPASPGRISFTQGTILAFRKAKPHWRGAVGKSGIDSLDSITFEVFDANMSSMGEFKCGERQWSDLEFESRLIKDADYSSDETVAKAQTELDRLVKTGEYNPTKTPDFFKENNNAIVRSFNSTRGKGLAGVITSLGLNYGAYPWEISPGKRAPMVIDVALGFSPIHDLPLGLDYEGSIRAPSHPVGKIAGAFGDVYTDELNPENAPTHVKEADLAFDQNGYKGKLKEALKGASDESRVKSALGLG